MSSADLAIKSASWFPWIPIWLGIQQNITFLMWLMEFKMFKDLMIISLATFLFLIDKSTEMESEWMMNILELFVKSMLSAKCFASVSVVNIDASFGTVGFVLLVECCSTYSFVAVFGAICLNMGVDRVFFLDVGEFLLIKKWVFLNQGLWCLGYLWVRFLPLPVWILCGDWKVLPFLFG